ncbi:anthranilate synthase component I family protein [Patescibacteria group bacterium]|nr:MAG: anthranilate synthase component I family protein [Patescibacteria group bacterium]
MSVDLGTLKMDDVLRRLGSTEKHVSVASSTTAHGWTSIIAWNPVKVFETPFDDSTNPTSRLEKFVQDQQTDGRLTIGYLSYDLGCTLHQVTMTTDDDLHTPLVFALAFDNWISFDQEGSTFHSKTDTFDDEVASILSRPSRPQPTSLYEKAPSPVWPRESYNAAYQKVHDYIEAGDIYQANLTHRLEGTTELDGLDIYRKVSITSQADFQIYIGGTDFEVISASPERFVRIVGGKIETSPIKGTRPRGTNAAQDEALRLDLETNVKDLAELNMITDLMRNDLGAVSEIGSVAVSEKRVLTSYPTLWHAHSTITSELRSDISPIRALISLMPGGSITGCPKKRAMEIIDEVEVKRRGIYTGSIFVIQPTGELDSNIAIRTMIKKGADVYLSVGGGIVYDSKLSDEYDETIQKAAVFLN